MHGQVFHTFRDISKTARCKSTYAFARHAKNLSEGRPLQRGLLRCVGSQKVVDDILTGGRVAEFLNKQKKYACREESLCKCEHLLGLIVPTKKFLPLQELSDLRKSLKHAGSFRISAGTGGWKWDMLF